jgi:hypothetical protein
MIQTGKGLYHVLNPLKHWLTCSSGLRRVSPLVKEIDMATARVNYYSGTEEVFGPFGLKNQTFEQMFPGVKGKRSDSFTKLVGFPQGARFTMNGEGSKPVTRVIFFKKNASLHKCDARCLSATGHNCECSCGGKNHGAGG